MQVAAPLTCRWLALAILAAATGRVACAADAAVLAREKAEVVSLVARQQAIAEGMARDFFAHPEAGYLEVETSRRLIRELKKAGFTVAEGVAGIPTAFVASYGSGSPVIGILGEMDALPGPSQAAVPVQQEVKDLHLNQGCGHNLFAAGSAAAAIAVKNWLVGGGHAGTIRFYGTPAEEGGSGKVYMVRAGLFNDADVVLHWHPAMVNAAIPVSNNAVISAKFRFHGKASHAATSPERGRSALDAVEAMDYMVNMMREHTHDGARISYIITRGGDAPNIVPASAEVYYYVRESSVEELQRLWERVTRAANGAAMGTETTVDWEVVHGTYNLLPNDALERLMDHNLRERAGTLHWTDAEQDFARRIYSTFEHPWLALGTESEVQPYQPMYIPGSTDVGDVSWTVPTAGLVTSTWVPSTDAHTWQAASASGASIGLKGMRLASEAIAMTAADLFLDPALVAAALKEFRERRGKDFVYRPLVGDRAPPLDYRKPGATP